MTPKTLRTLLDGLAGCQVLGDVDVPVTGVAYHSREVAPGGLFVALKGCRTDGHLYLPPASPRAPGWWSPSRIWPRRPGVTVVRVPQARLALAHISAAFYDHPSRELTLVGITGTNGKTSTTYILEAILNAAGCRVGVVGTVNYRVGDRDLAGPGDHPRVPGPPAAPPGNAHPGRHPRLPGGLLPCPGFKAGGRRPSSPPGSSPTSPRTTWTTTGTWTNILPPNPGSFWKSWPTAAPPGGWRSSTWTTPGGGSSKTPSGCPALTYGLHPESLVRPLSYRFRQDGLEARLTTPGGGSGDHLPPGGALSTWPISWRPRPRPWAWGSTRTPWPGASRRSPACPAGWSGSGRPQAPACSWITPTPRRPSPRPWRLLTPSIFPG